MLVYGQLAFEFDHDEDMNPHALAGFQAAGARWSAVLRDPITVNLNIGFRQLSTRSLASVDITKRLIEYAEMSSALAADQSSSNDLKAVRSLPPGTSLKVRLNNTEESEGLNYTATRETVLVPLANARAVGLYTASGGTADGSITFNSSFNFDFEPSDGIIAGAYDFVGIATHEIGHALGFYSGVDHLDANPGIAESATYQTPLDLFRYSLESAELGLIDGTADAREKFFSLDGGETSLALFATGLTFGDGRQASHWKDNRGLGILDPTAALGEGLRISALDRVAFDAIGYDLTPVPEPAHMALGAVVLTGAAIILRRRGGGAGRVEKSG